MKSKLSRRLAMGPVTKPTKAKSCLVSAIIPTVPSPTPLGAGKVLLHKNLLCRSAISALTAPISPLRNSLIIPTAEQIWPAVRRRRWKQLCSTRPYALGEGNPSALSVKKGSGAASSPRFVVKLAHVTML